MINRGAGRESCLLLIKKSTSGNEGAFFDKWAEVLTFRFYRSKNNRLKIESAFTYWPWITFLIKKELIMR